MKMSKPACIWDHYAGSSSSVFVMRCKPTQLHGPNSNCKVAAFIMIEIELSQPKAQTGPVGHGGRGAKKKKRKRKKSTTFY